MDCDGDNGEEGWIHIVQSLHCNHYTHEWIWDSAVPSLLAASQREVSQKLCEESSIYRRVFRVVPYQNCTKLLFDILITVVQRVKLDLFSIPFNSSTLCGVY